METSTCKAKGCGKKLIFMGTCNGCGKRGFVCPDKDPSSSHYFDIMMIYGRGSDSKIRSSWCCVHPSQIYCDDFYPPANQPCLKRMTNTKMGV